MKLPATTTTKKRFLKYFLNYCRLKNEQCLWFLENLIENDHLLNNIHFVTNANEYKKSIIISCECSEKVAFQFRKEHVLTSDVERAFHEIRFHPNEYMYIQLNFNNPYVNKYYQKLISDDLFTSDNFVWQQMIKSTAENILREQKISFLKGRINRSLDANDENSFFKLTEQLNKLIYEQKD